MESLSFSNEKVESGDKSVICCEHSHTLQEKINNLNNMKRQFWAMLSYGDSLKDRRINKGWDEVTIEMSRLQYFNLFLFKISVKYSIF
jgi:hypothetical protein